MRIGSSTPNTLCFSQMRIGSISVHVTDVTGSGEVIKKVLLPVTLMHRHLHARQWHPDSQQVSGRNPRSPCQTLHWCTTITSLVARICRQFLEGEGNDSTDWLPCLPEPKSNRTPLGPEETCVHPTPSGCTSDCHGVQRYPGPDLDLTVYNPDKQNNNIL